MIKLRRLLILAIVFIGSITLSACGPVDHDPNDIKNSGNWIDVDVKYNQIELHWDESYFIHDSLRVDIPNDWFGYGQKSDFDDLNKHDLIYQYKKKTTTYWSGETLTETQLRDIDHEHPSESTVNFKISIVDVDLDSKLLIQDELANDYYFKYDFNNDYNNFCYFRMAKNDVNQLKSGAMNEIRLDLVVLTHIDGSSSFKLRNDDGVTEAGYYSNVGVYFNSELTVNN